MRISEIDFPELLLASQKDGNLAVFAGAGVSMPAPSNYPNFEDLAVRVAGGVLVREHEEPIDRFLGRLADRGTNVHRIVSEILTSPDSKPNTLHFDLLRLFHSSRDVRLVTTNFDPHFSTAAPVVFAGEDQCEVHYAPALPPGDSFSGIVYPHGGVERPFERLVLTDSDFGRAYLTEGWARIFLQKLFERYTVLFIGYSHNDPIMNYLARGLPPVMGTRKRFALTAPGQEEIWKYRGIIPITYKLSEGNNNPHSGLPKAVSAWAKQVRLGALEQEQRIRSIVELPPPIDPEDADYVEVSLSDLATTRFFTRHAQTVSWLKWAEEKKLLRRLFDPHAEVTEVEGELGLWFAERFASEHAGESLSVLRRQGGRLSPFLWVAIARRLARNRPERLASAALHPWLAVLLNTRPSGTRLDFLEYVGPNLVFPDDTVPALLLFEYLSRPIVRLEDDFWSEIQGGGGPEKVKFKVRTIGDSFWLNHLWTSFFAPNLSALANRLEPTISSHLEEAYLLSHADSETDPNWDSLSSSRNAIEKIDYVGSLDGFGVLVDAGLAVMQWNAQHEPPRSDALIAQWFGAQSFLLKRLAIFGVSLTTHWTADRKLEWLLSNDLLYKPFVKHEVFEVLKGSYPQSSSDFRKVLLERALRGPQRVPEGHEVTAAYETYNLVYWLQQSDPQCDLAKRAYEDLQATHPEFGEREHPDLDVDFSVTWGGDKSPKTVEDLLSKNPVEQIEYLLSFKAETPFGPSRDRLLQEVNEAVVRKHEWGRELAAELQNRGVWDTDVWTSILLAWSRAELSDAQWNEVLTFLQTNEKLHGTFVNEIASLLEKGIKKASRAIPDQSLGVAVDLSKRLWSVAIAQDGRRPKEKEDPDWLARAINHPAGDLTFFWLSWLVRAWRLAGTGWQGIPDDIREVLQAVTTEPSYAGELGRVLLASQLNFLWSADEAWAKDYVLPFFDWLVDGKRALQALHGFLTWGRQTENLVPRLIPMYEKAFSHMAEFGRLRGRFAEYLAGAAFATSVNPFDSGWLNRFVGQAAREDRISWATFVRQMLRGAVDEARTVAWKSWIKPYWKQRILGMPIPLDAVELGEMVEWGIHLGPEFPDVVEIVCSSPAFELGDSFLFRELADTQLPEKHPSAVSALLLVVLKNTRHAFFDLDRVEDMVRRIAPLRAPMDKLKGICNELARLGYHPAAALDGWLQNRDLKG